jgi:putative DNA primase/helicase
LGSILVGRVMDDRLDFSPLSDDEREAQELAADGGPDAARPTCPPADAEPPEAAAGRLFGSSPDALWRYVDAGSALAFCVCRWNKPDGDKDIRPLSWFDGEGWRFAHRANARPLYNAARIAASPDAPVVVCEGEKAADAAARIFPNSIATTSSGGANAATKTDWTPLAGRRILIWPDDDDPGRKYAREVAAILAELDCDVSIVDVVALCAQDNPRGAERGYDAADALADWPEVKALRKAAASLAKPFDPGPAYVSCPPYTMDANGLAMEKPNRKGETETFRIAAPFEVLGACRDPHGSAWGKLLRWRDDDSRLHTRHVADADLHGEPAALCGSLAHEGLRIDRMRHREFLGYLNALRPKRRATIVTRTGWHEIGGRSVFVLLGETIGPRGGERVILDAAASGAYEAHGIGEEWRDGAAKLASGHALLVLAISVALAGPLLHLAGIEGGGVHFFGPSSIGKTTLLRLAASVWGRGDAPGYVRSWRATANGLEGAAAGATDTALILDEVGQVEARDMAAALYSLANGAGKARAARDGALREPRSWRVLTISSGEVPVDAKLIEDRGRKPRAGQLVRMLDIPAARAFGVFDHAGPDGDAATLAKACKRAAVSAYGTAGPEFVRRLIAEGVSGEDIRLFINGFVAAEVPAGADGQIDRVAQRLGLIMAAGELATKFRLTGWRAGEARYAAAWALKQWIKGRGGIEAAEVHQAIEQVRLMIEAHGESRFQSLDDPDAKPVPNRLGWRKGAGREREWWVPPVVWKTEICAGLDAQFVARALGERGMLRRQGGNTLQCTVNVGGDQRVRAYVLTAAILDGGGDAG